MSRNTLSSVETEEMDRLYREGGLRRMASPHIHYSDSKCPHSHCDHQMEWIDFRIELYGDRQRFYEPLVKAWWEGTGFAGRCPGCSDWIRFTTQQMEAIGDDQAGGYPQLPDTWHTIAQFA